MNINNRILKRFLRLAVIYIIAVAFVCAASFILIKKSTLENLKFEELSRISDLDYLVDEIMGHVRSDVKYLTKQTELFRQYDSHEFERHLNETYLQYTISKKIFDQIRYIDISGIEKVRVNLEGDSAYHVSNNKLQYKGDRYYFKEILKLDRNCIYFSPFDLNKEDGKVEEPHKPMIRIGMPVFDDDTNKIGIVVVNYLGKNILSKLTKISNPFLHHILLLNPDGYYLKGLDCSDEWGFMFEGGENKTFLNDFPVESNIVYSGDEESFYTSNGLFCFNTVWPVKRIKEEEDKGDFQVEVQGKQMWKLISYLPDAEIKESVMIEFRKWLLFLVTTFVPMFIVFWFLAKNIELKQYANQKIKLNNVSLEQKNKQIFLNLQELKELNTVLDKSNNSLNESNEKLTELNATKDKFFSILAHDLKNPFSAILSLVKILNSEYDNFDDVKRKEMLEMLNKSGQNVFSLLENLLTWATSQRGLLVFEPKCINVNGLINEVVKVQSEALNRKNIELHFNKFENVYAFSDYYMIYTVVTNLVSNAIKFTKAKGEISIQVTEENEMLKISIQDNGVGMLDDQIQKLFKIEHSISRLGTEKEKGTGLGLLLCKEFIDKNGGELWVESEINKGSTFNFTLLKSE